MPIVTRRLKKNRGRIVPALMPPEWAMNHVASIGPAIPRRPAVTVSQIIIPVARSRLTRQLPQMVAQLLALVEDPIQ